MKKQTQNRYSINIISFFVLMITIYSCTESNLLDGIRDVKFKATATRSLITEGETIIFKDSSLNVATRIWTFEGGDISSSDQQEASVVYGSEGTFKTNLEVTYDDATTESNHFNVQVFPKVIADFEASSTTALFGSKIKFTNKSKNVDSEYPEAKLKDGYTWTFEGGTPATSTAKNPEITYNTPGVYKVKLVSHREAPSNNGIAEKVNYITVLQSIPLVPEFEANITEVEAQKEVTFTDKTTGNADGWIWTFTGGTPATSAVQNPTVKYTTAGTYSVTLKAKRSVDGEEQTITKTNYIKVIAATGPYCTTPANLVGCGNNDGEKGDLSDWEILDNSGGDISSKFSVSTTRFSAGAASLKHIYDEPGKPAFTDNVLKYKEKLVKVDVAADYTVSLDAYAEILSAGSIEFVAEVTFEKVGGGSVTPKPFFRKDGNTWQSLSATQNLTPGDYFIQIKIWNPGFNKDLKYDLYLDELKVVKN